MNTLLSRRQRLLLTGLGILAQTLSFSSGEISGQDSFESVGNGSIIWSLPDSRTEVAAGAVFFRKPFDTPDFFSKKKSTAVLHITCDDGYRVYLNGREIGSDKVWQSIESYDISADIKPEKNVIAVQAENASPSPAGLYASIRFENGKQTATLPTDKSWRFSTTPTPGWRFADFAEKNWKPAFEQGKIGVVEPWSGRFTIQKTSAKIAARPARRLQRDGFELVDGDRVVLLGGTFVERMQSNDYFETFLTSRFPNRNLTFRNLGWSGDNVFGLSRAVFGTQSDGFRRLENDMRIANPTLVVVCYGRNESFQGEEYLPTFLSGLENLVAVLQTTGAEICFLSPSLMENLGPPLPDPAPQNKKIRLYANAIRDFAKSNGYHFIDNLKPLGATTVSKTDVPAIRDRLTDNGIHLSEYGYWRIAPHLARKFGAKTGGVELSFDLASQSVSATGTTIHSVEFGKSEIKFLAKDDNLTACPPPQNSPRGGPMMAIHDRIQVTGLPPGKYGLKINDVPSIMATHEQWEVGVLINRGKFVAQPKELRRLIKRKNEMFFHRYRPQNETYLFLFRKHEQGNNAVEIPQFDPIIADLEKQIADLKKAKPLRYSLEKIPDTSN